MTFTGHRPSKIFFNLTLNLLDIRSGVGNNLGTEQAHSCSGLFSVPAPSQDISVFCDGAYFFWVCFFWAVRAGTKDSVSSGFHPDPLQSPMNSDRQTCERVLFSGHVQGVGFRYTAHQVAQSYDVTGWVRNLPNGSVEMKIAGSSVQVQQCLEDLQSRMARYIREVHRTPASPDESMTGFEVRH